ncbi:hypothetical protein HanXRQr2_Chr09g0413111 [Helianthus annuus]|uniref:Uncharacterized protein n=1 Tax=Helianthus annuus TaxID=4232 RepID=A0A9K3NAH5_HELAN|nr:hypothetical protein HanXRQr2_Chr09g0413111 [Helianthus annuus]
MLLLYFLHKLCFMQMFVVLGRTTYLAHYAFTFAHASTTAHIFTLISFIHHHITSSPTS